jgi:hypothetical protein
MPNWCETDLASTGPKQGVDAFFENAKRVEKYQGREVELLLRFDNFLP